MHPEQDLTEVSISLPPGWEETLFFLLEEEGWGQGVLEQRFPAGHLDDEPVGRPGDARLAWVVEAARADALQQRLDALLADFGLPAERLRRGRRPVARADWEQVWRERWRPYRCAGFVVHADFHRLPHGLLRQQAVDARPHAPDLPLLLPTGSAFGTGGHPSTRIALRSLRRCWEERRFGTVLDVGMGTGILAVAAARLGARYAAGMDPDPPAAAQARKMARLNGVDTACHFWRGTLDSARGTWDVVLANLQSGLLQRYAGTLAARLGPEGRLFVGGFMDRNAPATRAALEAAGLRATRQIAHGRWRAAELRRA